jgi:hypothetical protein
MTDRAKIILAVFAVTTAIGATSILSYRAGIDQGSSVALCLVSTFQKGIQEQGLDMTSPACRAAKEGEDSVLWVFRERHT